MYDYKEKRREEETFGRRFRRGRETRAEQSPGLIPLVIKHTVAAEHFGQSIDDVADKPPIFAGKRNGDGEAS